MEKRFRIIKDVGVYDELTGKTYSTYQEFCKLLNLEDDIRNRIAEEYYELDMEYKNIMRKYEIDNIEKLDQVLFNQRVW